MEKLIFTDETELPINGVSRIGDAIRIIIHNGDITALESRFSNQAPLEKIILVDETGNPMSAFKNFAIFREICKQKSVIVDEITDEVADVVTVTLEQEPEWIVSQRKQDARIDSVQETADTLVIDILS